MNTHRGNEGNEETQFYSRFRAHSGRALAAASFVIFVSFCKQHSGPFFCVHSHRVAGGHCDHRHPRLAAFTGAGQGESQSPRHPVSAASPFTTTRAALITARAVSRLPMAMSRARNGSIRARPGAADAFRVGLSAGSALSQQPGSSLAPRPLHSPTPVTAADHSKML